MADKTKHAKKTVGNNPQFIPDYQQLPSRVYSNYVAVRTTGIDFTITFMDVAPPNDEQLQKAQKGKPVEVPVTCEVVVPNTMIPSLIEALQTQYEKLTKETPSNTA